MAGIAGTPGTAGMTMAPNMMSAGTSGAPQGGAGAGGAMVDAGQGGQPAPDAGEPVADAGDAGTTDPPRSTGPGDWTAGDYPPDLMGQTYLEISGVAGQNGYVRQYKVHVPPSYDPQTPTPLVFCFHGLGQNAVMFCVTGASMVAKSDEKGFILVMPNGYQNSWNAGTCCGGASAEQLDDVALIRAILEEVGTHVNIDLDRVYATGLSNGGYMSYRLACEAADLFAAVAPGAGALGINTIGGGTNPTSDFTTCTPSQPVSVFHPHGTADGLVPYTLQKPSLDHFAQANGCSLSTMPAVQPASAGDTTCVSYTGCPAGIEVTGCSVQEGGHVWFGSEDCGTGAGAVACGIVGNNSDTLVNTDAIWDFFARTGR